MDYQKMREFRNTCNPFAAKLGISVDELEQGRARASMKMTPELLNPVHRPHGGCYFSLADTACGSAMASYGYAAVTVSASYNFFRSANVGDTVTAEAQEIKSGRTICVFGVRLTGPDGTLLGDGSFTYYRLEEKLEL